MKKPLALAAAVLPVAVLAAAQVRAPELPDVRDIRAAAAAAAAAVPAPAPSAGAPAKALPPTPKLDGAVIGHGLFASDFDVSVGETKIGKIETGSGSYAFKNANGDVIVSAKVETRVEGLLKVATLTDASGTKIGSVSESIANDCSVFTIRDAAGATVAMTGCVDGSRFELALDGAKLGAVSSANWLLDKYRVDSLDARVDPRAAAIAVVMNDAAGYARASARNRERMADRPGPRESMHGR